MTPFEKFFSKLSENPKNFNIGSPEFKLWHLKEALKFAIFQPWTMGYNPWYRQIGKYFYLSNTKFDDTTKLSEMRMNTHHFMLYENQKLLLC